MSSTGQQAFSLHNFELLPVTTAQNFYISIFCFICSNWIRSLKISISLSFCFVSSHTISISFSFCRVSSRAISMSLSVCLHTIKLLHLFFSIHCSSLYFNFKIMSLAQTQFTQFMHSLNPAKTHCQLLSPQSNIELLFQKHLKSVEGMQTFQQSHNTQHFHKRSHKL